MRRFTILGLGLLAALVTPIAARAADRALIIGVGDFTAAPENRLPGINLDVAMMEGVAKRLGYADMRELRDQQGTRAAILAQLRTVLIDQAGPHDRVLIYFSGHGTRVTVVDPQTGERTIESAIVGSDVHVTTNADGRTVLHGVVNGKEFADLIKASPARSVMLIVDACHSGSIDKAVALGRSAMGNRVAVRKLFTWPGMPSGPAKALALGPRDDQANAHYVSMAAAGDSESALATQSGSLFTVGLSQAIADTSAGGSATPRQIMRITADFITREADADQVFHPVLHGAPALMDLPVRLSDTRAGGGPNWTEVSRITGGLPGIALTGVKTFYKDGQEVAMALTLPSDGYLNVIAVGPDDTITLLYPNRLQPDNHVRAGTIALPADIPQVHGQQIYYPVGAPYGKTLIAAILTRSPRNLFETAADVNGGKDLRTPSLAAIKDLIALGDATRSVLVGVRSAPGEVSAWGAMAETMTCSAQGC